MPRSVRLPTLLLAAALAVAAVPRAAAPLAAQQAPPAGRVDVRLQPDQAEATLRLAGELAAGRTPHDSLWQRLLASEGYVRLARRERGLGRPFTDSAFRAFVASPALAGRLPALRATLRDWSALDPSRAAARAFAYLPAGTRLRATIYPAVKPASNSFVFETRGENPAIFLYVDPTMPAAKFENVLAHELHHIGITAGCAALPDSATPAEPVRTTLAWMGALHEGVAMLAAAGGASVHPHATSDSAERAVWERDLARVGDDVRALEQFWLGMLDGRYPTEEAQRAAAMRFFATDTVPQGAHYTVGWLMASTIERELGRERLVASLCDARLLLGAYEAAAARRGVAKEPLPRWSPTLLRRLGVRSGARQGL